MHLRDEYHDPLHEVDWERLWSRQEERADHAARIAELAGLGDGARVLDVGSGPGFFALEYARRVAPRGLVVALDISDAALRMLESRRGAARNVEALMHDLEAAPIPRGGFDVAIVSNVLHHVRDPAAALARVKVAAREIVVAEFDPEGPGEIGPPRDERIAPSAMARLLRGAGWAPGEPRAIGFETYAIAGR